MFNNAKPRLPAVFLEIIKNDREREEIRDRFVAHTMRREDWYRLAELVADRKNLRCGAEDALRWNTNKGQPPRAMRAG